MDQKNKIDKWMESFKSAWLSKDIGAVFDLLSDDVEYWETPFLKLSKGNELRKAWEEILSLYNMDFSYNVFVTDEINNKYAVKWNFSHDGGESAGTYLIQLNDKGLCTYFYHSFQSKV